MSETNIDIYCNICGHREPTGKHIYGKLMLPEIKCSKHKEILGDYQGYNNYKCKKCIEASKKGE